MKIVCVCLNSKYIHSSLSPWCLKAGIEEFCNKKHEVHVIESTINSNMSKLYDEICSLKPELIAFSCYIWSIEKILDLCLRAKNGIRCTIALGGPEVEYRAEEMLRKHRFIDYIISGEGEWSFASLIDFLENGFLTEKSEGINYIEKELFVSLPKKIHSETPPSPYCDEYFRNLNGRIAYIEASRGCPFKCAYCLSGQLQGLRYFDEKLIFDSIVKLSYSGTKTIKFIDRTFNADFFKANRILEFIKNEHGKTISTDVCFHFEIAAGILHERTIEILASMPKGLCQLEIGIQTFNQSTLSSINRNTNSAKLITNIRRLIACGNMHIHTDLIAGLPYEDIESFKNSFNQAFSLKSDMLQLGFLKLLYGAEMRENSNKYPCEYNNSPPYEIISNEWLSSEDLDTLKCCEVALDRLYNSQRFLFTLEYLFGEMKFDPFDTFCAFGKEYNFNRISLTEFTEKVWLFFKDKCDTQRLKECILCDINCLPVNIHIPDSIISYNPLYKRIKK